MTPEQFKRAAELFDALCDLPASQWPPRLDADCHDDPVVRRRVEAMLAHDESEAEALAPAALVNLTGLAAEAPLDGVEERRLPARIGAYTVVRVLGEGGMGVVLEAQQEQPSRRVAIKLLRDGLPSAEALARFRREVELLGRLQHPCIAHIYEAGSVELSNGASQPFFAMEYIDGLPLTRYAQEHRLSGTQRLALMASICDAVHYAHEQGVLHRDLKPANILVQEEGTKARRHEGTKASRHDGTKAEAGPKEVDSSLRASAPSSLRAFPKILDFGVGRVMAAGERNSTLHTNTGRLMGTLAYMSPEQVDGGATTLDARSDVYALGVILFELLASHLPIDLRDASIGESIRRIREDDPPSLGSIDRLYRGDIATIVAKALEKDRNRRYATAADLAADVRRYLSDEPVVARRATTLYQLSKFARRHKAIALGSTIAALALVVAVVLTSWQALAATRSRDLARLEALKANQIKQFLQQILASAAPEREPTNDVGAVSLLDRASKRIEAGDFGDQPDVLGELRLTLGQAYLVLGQYQAGEVQLRRTCELLADYPAERETRARALEGLGAAYELENRYAEAEARFKEARQLWIALGEPEHLPTEVWPHGLPSVMYFTGRYDEAETAYREALAYARDHFGDKSNKVAEALSGLGVTLEAKGRTDDAIAAHQEAVDIYRGAYGDTSMSLANALNNMGNAMQGGGDAVGAAAAHREALAIRRRLLPPNHPDIAMSLGNLALVLHDLGQYDEAEAMDREALAIRRAVLPPIHHSTAVTLNNLASTLRLVGRYDEALEYYDEAIDMAERALPEGHIMPIVFRANRAVCLAKMGRVDEAEVILKTCYEQLSAKLGASHRRAKHVASDLAELYGSTGRPELADCWRQ